MIKWMSSLALLLFVGHPCGAIIHFVNTNATGVNDGTSWIDSYNDLQSALAAAVSGDSIWVAAGTYKPVSTFPFSPVISFAVPSGVALFGGFAGNETSFAQRNISANTTTLSGNVGSSRIYNSWHVVSMENASQQTRLDGFTITDGYAGGSAPSNQEGGGLYIFGNNYSSPVIANCIFSRNFCINNGAAINKTWLGTTTLLNCKFMNNSAQGSGGAIAINDTAIIRDCLFTGNQSLVAGAAFFPGGGSVMMDRCVFSDNQASVGAVFFGDYNTSTTSNTLIAGNVTSGCIFCVQQAVPNNNVHRLINTTIADNKNLLNNQEAVKLTPTSTLSNSIVWGNATTIQVSPGISALHRNIIQMTGVPADNFNSDPQFRRPAGNMAAPFNVANFDYSPKASSPAVDKGGNTLLPSYISTDVVNISRIYGNRVDMGAYEVQYCSIPARIISGGATNFCVGDSVMLTANSGPYGYEWNNGLLTRSVTATTAGTFTVIVSDSLCRGYDSITTTVMPAPTPVIVQNAGVLSTTVPFSTYQWKNNGANIVGATSPTFTPSASGSYSVAVTNSNGCTGTSPGLPLRLAVSESRPLADKIVLYPLPAKDFLFLYTATLVPVKMEVYDQVGTHIQVKPIDVTAPGTYRINIAALPQGIYLLRVETNGEYLTRLFCK